MPRYDETPFRATHNSYSGGLRGSIVDQLACGVRLIEFDIHARGYAALGDFRLGHLKVGAEVALGQGNPDTVMLADWLGVVAHWSDEHIHAPITVVLDSKDDLASPDCGGHEDLNERLEATLGTRLFTRDDYDAAGAWPDVTDMTSRILCVISGDGNTRASYRWAYGTQPAMAVNAKGDAVLVYRSTAGDLHCFVGAIGPAGAIAWQTKTVYCYSRLPLLEPAVGLNDDGWIVAVHRFVPPEGFIGGTRLESIVGRIATDRRTTWAGRAILAIGGAPRLRLDGTDLVEWHLESGGPRRVKGVLDTQRGHVEWAGPQPSGAVPPPADSAAFGGRTYRCATDAAGAILCGPQDALAPVRFRQLAFVEEQKGDDRGTIRDALFFAADAKDRAALAAAAARGQVVRAWGVESVDVPCPARIAATDDPRAAWYETYTTGTGVVV